MPELSEDVMDRILPIAMAMLRDQTVYDPSRRSTTTRRSGDDPRKKVFS